jgi:hypothetical protein
VRLKLGAVLVGNAAKDVLAGGVRCGGHCCCSVSSNVP